MTDDTICPNGVNALTGGYLTEPMTHEQAAALARGTPTPAAGGWLKRLVQKITGPFLGLPADIDATDPAQAGWAVVFPKDTPEEVKAALAPLIEHRAKAIPADRCKVLEFRPGETRERWLQRHGAHGSDVEPTAVPYYVLLIGPPDVIPFEFQYELDVDYAVGRLVFDTPAEYRAYAEGLVAHETGNTPPADREVVFWGTRHSADRATQLSADYLITPLAEGEPNRPAVAAKYKFQTTTMKVADATKANLLEVLHGRPRRPAVLFTASHGVGGWPKDDPRLEPAQGALLCQEWGGFGAVDPAHYLTASEVGADAKLNGLVAFLFACYGAGTPQNDPYLSNPTAGPKQVAERPFVSALARRLLAGGALAVVGHVERAWAYSIRPPGVSAQLLPFRNFLSRVMAGDPVGHAMLDFGQRYATASVGLLNKLNPTQAGAKAAADPDLARAWVERNDAQNYVLLGDPAARLGTSE